MAVHAAGNTAPGAMDQPQEQARHRSRLQQSQAKLAWIMLLPTLLALALVAFYPLASTFFYSLTNARLASNRPTRFIGLQNFQDLLSDTDFVNSIGTTVRFTLITVVFEFLLGMIVALVINSNFKGRGAMRAIMLVPWAIPTAVSHADVEVDVQPGVWRLQRPARDAHASHQEPRRVGGAGEHLAPCDLCRGYLENHALCCPALARRVTGGTGGRVRSGTGGRRLGSAAILRDHATAPAARNRCHAHLPHPRCPARVRRDLRDVRRTRGHADVW